MLGGTGNTVNTVPAFVLCNANADLCLDGAAVLSCAEWGSGQAYLVGSGVCCTGGSVAALKGAVARARAPVARDLVPMRPTFPFVFCFVCSLPPPTPSSSASLSVHVPSFLASLPPTLLYHAAPHFPPRHLAILVTLHERCLSVALFQSRLCWPSPPPPPPPPFLVGLSDLRSAASMPTRVAPSSRRSSCPTVRLSPACKLVPRFCCLVALDARCLSGMFVHLSLLASPFPRRPLCIAGYRVLADACCTAGGGGSPVSGDGLVAPLHMTL